MLCHRLSLIVRLGSWTFRLCLRGGVVGMLAIKFGLRGKVRLGVEDIIVVQSVDGCFVSLLDK